MHLSMLFHCLLLPVLALLVSGFAVLDPSAPPTPTTIRIGFNEAKYTSPLDRPPLGRDRYRNRLLILQLWLSHLANTTDLLPGATVQLIDNSYDISVADALVKTLELLNKGIIAMIGSASSAVTKSTVILTESRHVPQCDGASGAPELSDKIAYPRFFRTKPSDNLQAAAIFDFVNAMGWRRVAIISETAAYGAGLTRTFQDLSANSTVKIVSLQAVVSLQTSIVDPSNSTTRWDNFLKNIRDANAFVILVFSPIDNVPGLAQAARLQGMMSSKYAWIGSDGVRMADPSSLRGFINTVPSDGDGPAYTVFKDLWDANAGSIDTIDKSRPFFGSSITSCLDLMLRGFDRYLRTTPGANLTRLAAGLENERFPSPAVMFNFPIVYTPLGKIALDPLTGDPKTPYDLLNVQGDPAHYVKVGSWDAITRNLTIDRTIYYGWDASTVKPSDDINLADFTVTISANGVIGTVAIAFNVLAMLLILAAAVFFIVKRDDPTLRKVSIPSKLVMLFGLLLPCLDVLTMVDTPTVTHCVADIWLIGLGFAVVLGALSTKLLRLFRIFNGIQAKIKGISNSDLLVQTGVPILVEMALLLIWTLNDAPKPTLLQINPVTYYYACSSSSTRFQGTMMLALIVWNGLLLAVCTMLAIATRNVRADFNEAKIVGLCVYNQVVIVVLALPLLISGSGKLSLLTLFSLKQAAILMIVYVTLGAVHGSKIYAALTEEKAHGKSTDLEHQPKLAPPLLNRVYSPASPSPRQPLMPPSNDTSETDDSDSPQMQRSRMSRVSAGSQSMLLHDQPIRRFFVSYKEHNIAPIWITAELVHVTAIDLVVFKRTKLHVSKSGAERGSRRSMQMIFNGPHLFLRDIKKLDLSLDASDGCVVDVRTDKTLILSIKFGDAQTAREFVGIVAQDIQRSA
ncbi:periplasmic binding protein-like I [Entophlyctis helioformis]|nr:periplasmic binding protein-like I [Entophlyctis helioformis]